MARVVLDGRSADDALTLALGLFEDVRRHYKRSEDIPLSTTRRLCRLLSLARQCQLEAEAALAELIADGVVALAFGETQGETPSAADRV
jgi:hypothetical protein